MNPSVSVVILVYKVEQYIEQCARTLFGQTLDSIEYIFVDDCSPDASISIMTRVLDDYPSRRSQVKILRNEANSGQAYSRRKGVEAATGDYLIHCDSDDWMELNMLEQMYMEAKAYDADAVVCGWMQDNKPVLSKYTKVGVNCRDFIFSDMIAISEMQSLWRYLIKRELYVGVEFPVHNQGEDHSLLVQLIYFSKRVFCLEQPLYHWRYNETSITHAPSPQSVLNRFEGASANARQVEAFLIKQGLQTCLASQIVALKLYCRFCLRPLLRKGEGVRRWRKAFPEIKGKIIFNQFISVSHKVEYLVNMYCPTALIKLAYKWRNNSQS